MTKILVTVVFVLVGGSLGYNFLPYVWALITSVPRIINNPITNMVLGAIVLYFLSVPATDYVERAIVKVENFLSDLSASYLLFGSLGMIIGLILSWLINLSLVGLQIPGFSDVLPIITTAMLAYLGFRLATSRREEIRRVIIGRGNPKEEDGGVLERKVQDNFRRNKILDTSVIIDGRIYDIVQTGFLEGSLIIPNFVLRELQRIADSSDSIKRVRGRRGLDILNSLQKEEGLTVEMYDGDVEEADEVDEKLVVLAKKMDGMVVTNDYNLNKVCEFQNVPVLNVNDLANAIKPVVIPGEEMHVMIIKQGTERSQGVAYLDDGTMVVVEDGQHYMNKSIDVVVTSALQTSAGRMIFARPVHSSKKLKEKE
ncbi:PIN/TRAM domain-containing protein [Atopococcus tabaci]|uniref:PIN/TRAM domain-containing protein n=1 Tax=Atopococcus tabaci TaxID=269774 RepID=UPI0024096C6B|nr:PIN/TRAM domain-containing protein [Atopococcus tabaci]